MRICKFVHYTNINFITGQFGNVFQSTLLRESGPIKVAVKTFRNINNSTKEASFIKEMAQLSRLVHPNIIKMHGMIIEGMP